MDNKYSVNATTACYPGMNYIDACIEIESGIHDPFFGLLSQAHVQLCAQNAGLLDEFTLKFIKKVLPKTQFRLHSSAKVVRFSKGFYPSCYGSSEAAAFFNGIKHVSHLLNASAYTIHAGTREIGLELLKNKILKMENDFGFAVGVEGLYPNGQRNTWLINSWSEYEWLLNAGIKYAIDMSHLNILYVQTGVKNETLISELIASENCIEIHVSDNEGDRDSHQPLQGEPWWYKLLASKSEHAHIFSEGIVR